MIYETALHLSPAPHTDASPVQGTDATDKALALTDWSTAPYYVRDHPLFADSDVLTAAGMTPAVIDSLWMLAKDQPQ